MGINITTYYQFLLKLKNKHLLTDYQKLKKYAQSLNMPVYQVKQIIGKNELK